MILKTILTTPPTGVLTYSNYASFPAVGFRDYLYIDSTTNAIYYWSGSAYVEIAQSDPIIDGEVATYGDLPAAASHSGETYYVKTYSILYPTKLPGLYYSDGASWARRSDKVLYSLTDLTDGALLRSNGGREIVESFDNPVTAELINAISGSTNVDLDSSGWLVMQGAASQNINFQDARNYPAVGWSFVAHNNATGTMYLANNAGVSQKDLAPGCTSIAILTDKSTANGTWVVKDIVPQDIRTTASPTFAGMNLGAGSLTVHSIKPDASDGLLIESNNGTDIGLLGAANTANVLWYGTHQFSLLTASQAVVTDASKNLTSLAYASANTASALVQRDGSGNFSAGTITAALSGNATTATTLATPRAIYGNNFDGSAALTQIIASTYGGTGNGFTKFSGATTTEKTYTLPNANCSILTDNATITVAQGGTGATSFTAGRVLFGNGTSALNTNANLFWDNTNSRLSIGAGTSPTGILHVQNSGSGTQAPLFERSGLTSDTLYTVARLLATRNGDMANNFGCSLQFAIKDTAAGSFDIAEIQVYRANSSDTTGNMVLRTYSAGTPFTNLQLTYDKTTTINVSSTAYAYFAASSLPYIGSANDVNLKLGSTSSNCAGGLQLAANYIGSELPGYIFNSRYGGNSSFRTDPDLCLSHYMGSAAAWQTRMLISYDRSFKFSTTGSGTNDVIFDASGNLAVGASSASARLHALKTTEQLRLGYDASNYTSFTVNSTGSLVVSPSGSYIQFDKGVYMNAQATSDGYVTTTQTNKTGNGTAYTIGTTDTLTTSTTQGSVLSGAGVFTAPRSGRYIIGASITLTGFTNTGCVCKLKISLSNGSSYEVVQTNPTAGDITISITKIVYITSATTATFVVTVTGEAGDTVDVAGGSGPEKSWVYTSQVS